MQSYIPLFQSILWISLILTLLLFFRTEIALVRGVLSKRLEEGAPFEFGWLKLGEIRKEQQRQAKEITWVKLLVKLVISDYERMHLQNLASAGPFIAEVHQGSTFEWELRHLLSLKLVERLPKKGVRSLISQGKGDIKAHLYISEQGKAYLKVLDEVRFSD
jgi:hypothetical protein